MTERTPEDLTRERLGGGYLDSVSERANYPGQRVGPGRWLWLRTRAGRVGILWTNDSDGLGFIGVSIEDNPAVAGFTPEIMSGIQGAAELGAHPTQVFDAWAARVGQGLVAEPVQGTLDLSSLNA